MDRLVAFWDSSVGKKAVMAVTGIIGVLFVIGHMVGNLQVFQGAERLNAYGHLLHGPLNELVWGARVVLLLALVLHVVAAYQLTMRNRAARPVEYATRTPQVSTLASRTLRWGGVLLLAFIVYHLLDLTIGTVNRRSWKATCMPTCWDRCGAADRGVLHRGDGRAGAAPVPRGVEQPPDAGRGAGVGVAAQAKGGRHHRDRHRGRVRGRPAGRPAGGCEVNGVRGEG
jgi:hypothetical protein